MTQKKIPRGQQAWIDARKRHRLSDAQVRMARELGLNPKKLGKIANHEQEPWKSPLPRFIEEMYRRRFRRDAPLSMKPMEEGVRAAAARKEGRPVEKAARRAAPSIDGELSFGTSEEVV